MTAAMTASIFSSSVGPAVANPPASRSTSRSALATRFIAHLHRSRPRGSSPLSFSVPPHYNSRRFADSQPGRFAPRMKILVLNCGSSSVKFQYIETDLERIDRNQDRRLASGLVEKIGTPEAAASCQAGERTTRDVGLEIADHHAAIAKVIAMLQQTGALADPKEIHALGHRVVHGGDFQSSQLITAEVLKKIEEAVELAPLHNPHNLKGYTVCRELFPDRPHVAVFDTAFHQTMPARAYLYALPYDHFRRHRIRRYGFHGTSHRYVAYRFPQLPPPPPPPHPPLRLPRPLAPLRRLPLPPAGRALERRD